MLLINFAKNLLCFAVAGCPVWATRNGGLPLTIDLSVDPTYYFNNKLCHGSLNVSWEMRFTRPQPLHLKRSG